MRFLPWKLRKPAAADTPLPPYKLDTAPITKSREKKKPREPHPYAKEEKHIALRQAINDATATKAFLDNTIFLSSQKQRDRAWALMKKLRQHERRLETILKRVFEFKQETREDERARQRIGDMLTTLEQVERAQDAMRRAFPNEGFPPELRILETREEQEVGDQLLRIRNNIQQKKEEETAKEFWEFLLEETGGKTSAIKRRQPKKRTA